MARPFCIIPWYSLTLGAGGVFQPCCRTLFEGGGYPSTKAEVMALFNDDGVVALRERLLSGEIAGTECADCLASRTAYSSTVPFFIESEPGFTDQVRAVYEAVDSGRTTVDHFPLLLGVGTSQRCNLRCAMCFQGMDQLEDLQREYPVQNLQSVLRETGLNVPCVEFIGGEPLLTGDGVSMLKFMAEEMEGSYASIITNGTLIKKRLSDLRALKRLVMEISVDGTGEAYEAIRVGATWAGLRENFDALIDVRRAHPEWVVMISSVVMKTSLPKLVELLRFSEGRADDIHFIGVTRDLIRENIFEYPSLLHGIGNWRGHFDEALELCRAHGRERAYGNLSRLRDRLDKLVTDPDGDTLAREHDRMQRLCKGRLTRWSVGARNGADTLDAQEIRDMIGWYRAYMADVGAEVPAQLDALMTATLAGLGAGDVTVCTTNGIEAHRGGRLVVWGTGGGYRDRWQQWLADNRDGFQVMGFIDSDPAKSGTELDGLPVYSPAFLRENEVDAVVVASAFRPEIIRQIQDMGLFRPDVI